MTVVGGTFTTAATLTVATLGTGGSVATVTVANPGSYTSLAGIAGTVTGGTGTGATFNINFKGQLVAQWYAIDVSSGTPAFQLVGGSPNVGREGFGVNTYAFEPAIAINPAGQIGLGFMESDTLGGVVNPATGGFISTFVTARNPTDAAGTMEPPVLVPAGTGTGNINGRIGDFSGMNVDPVNGTFWHTNEFGGGGPTVIANFAPTDPLNLYGDQDYPNENDTFRLVRDPSNNNLLDVYLNGTLQGQYVLADISQINVNGEGGNNTLIVYSSNGLIAVPNGIQYNSGNTGTGGFNTLVLDQPTSTTVQTSDTYSVGPNVGQGTDAIVGPGPATQTVYFTNLAPTFDSVPATTETVFATNASNAINYSEGYSSSANLLSNAPSAAWARSAWTPRSRWNSRTRST